MRNTQIVLKWFAYLYETLTRICVFGTFVWRAFTHFAKTLQFFRVVYPEPMTGEEQEHEQEDKEKKQFYWSMPHFSQIHICQSWQSFSIACCYYCAVCRDRDECNTFYALVSITPHSLGYFLACSYRFAAGCLPLVHEMSLFRHFFAFISAVCLLVLFCFFSLFCIAPCEQIVWML